VIEHHLTENLIC